MTLVVATFYKFVSLSALTQRQETLLTYCQQWQIKGTILLATEGINGTIAGFRQGIDAVLEFLRQDPCFADLQVKESTAEFQPFQRLKVKIKPEIVTLGIPEVDPSQHVGTYVKPKQWNELISNPEVTVIDTRNDYEVKMGSFQGANNPHTDSFRQLTNYVQENLDPAKHKKIAMFCTGGIRCEKATSYLLNQGFEEVYHLQGGILKYLEEIPPEDSLWEGDCFVFDERVAIKHGLEIGNYQLCTACGYPLSPADQQSPDYEAGISCPHCIDSLTEEKRKRQLMRLQQRKKQQ